MTLHQPIRATDPVATWLKRHGGPRRFANGDSADPYALKKYLADRGYNLSLPAGVWPTYGLRPLGTSGRGRSMKKRELFAFVDALRAADGLPPIMVMSC